MLVRLVRGRPRREGELKAFDRFPTWMWRNREFDQFVRWLRGHNGRRSYERMCGFYGLDLYNLSGSMSAVIDFLEREDPQRERQQKRSGFRCEQAEIPGASRLLGVSGQELERDDEQRSKDQRGLLA